VQRMIHKKKLLFFLGFFGGRRLNHVSNRDTAIF